jgi:hypothetical protein
MMSIIYVNRLDDKNTHLPLSNVVQSRLRATVDAVLRHRERGSTMTNIRNDEIERAGEGSAVVETEASKGLPTPLGSTDMGAADNNGGKERKAPKQSKAKSATGARSEGGGAPIAGGGTAETAAANEAGKSEQGGPAGSAVDVLASYPNLGAWPVSAGSVPLPAHILAARALGIGPGTKRELAVAAYLRGEAGQFTLIQVAEALRAVLGGEFNVQRNVVKGLEADGLVKLTKITKEVGGTSFHLELTATGVATVNKWLAENTLTHS